jgi:hypothetical protein
MQCYFKLRYLCIDTSQIKIHQNYLVYIFRFYKGETFHIKYFQVFFIAFN